MQACGMNAAQRRARASLLLGVARCRHQLALPFSRPLSNVAPRPTGSQTGGRWREHVFFGVPIALTFSLGVWQVRRLGRKRVLIAEREARLSAPAMSEHDLFEQHDASAGEHRRVALRGRFLHDREMLVGPRSAPQDLAQPVQQWAGTTGFLVVTPFVTEGDERAVLVVRGWVPKRLMERDARAKAAVSPWLERPQPNTTSLQPDVGNVHEVTAVVRRPVDLRSRFTPENNPSSGDWYYIDSAAMAKSTGLKALLQNEPPQENIPVIELLSPMPQTGWPFPKPERDYLEFRTPPSSHIIYATTWFSLSAAIALLTRSRYRAAARYRAEAVGSPRAS